MPPYHHASPKSPEPPYSDLHKSSSKPLHASSNHLLILHVPACGQDLRLVRARVRLGYPYDMHDFVMGADDLSVQPLRLGVDGAALLIVELLRVASIFFALAMYDVIVWGPALRRRMNVSPESGKPLLRRGVIRPRGIQLVLRVTRLTRAKAVRGPCRPMVDGTVRKQYEERQLHLCN